LVTSKNSVSPARISTRWQSSGVGLQEPSPVATASEETRKSAVSPSASTPMKTKKGSSAEGSGESRATSLRAVMSPSWPKLRSTR
jgi:hypothetical protein